MRRIFILLAIVALGGYFVFSFYHPPSKIKAGQKAPDFVLVDDQNKKIRLNDFLGKVVILNFWATWCPPCLAEMPSFEKVYQYFRSEGLILLAVNHDSVNLNRSQKAVQAFRNKVPFSFPVLYDLESQASSLYGIYTLPQTFIISRDGVVLSSISGPQDWTSPEILNIIKATLKK